MATRQTATTRAKDSDRDQTCKVLDSALADGQLSGEEHRQRVSAATTAATLGELHALVTDLQTDSAAAQLPNLAPARRLGPAGGGIGWGIKAAIAAVLVVLGMGIGWGLYGNTSSPLSFQSDPGAKPDGVPAKVLTPPRELFSVGGLTGLFEQMRQKFGDTKGFELTVFSEYASLERQDPTEPRRVLRYYYRGGWADPSETSVGSDARVVDLAPPDIPALVAVLRGAPATLGINPAEVKSMHVSIEPNPDIDAPPGDIEIAIYVSPQFGNGGYFQIDSGGTLKQIYPPTP